MTQRSLSTRALLELLELFEQASSALTDLDGHRLHGVPGWYFRHRTSLTARELADWMACVGYAGFYPAPAGDERVAVDLEEDDDPGRYGYRCPETFRRRFVPAAEVAVYAVSSSKLLHLIADLLDIPQALRRGITTATLENVFWLLGKARIGRALVEVWFARRLNHCVADVFQHLQAATLPEQGLVLTGGRALPGYVRPPRNYRFASLRDVLVNYVPSPCLDLNLLQRLVSSPADGVLPPVQAVYFDAVNQVLTIRTKQRPWHIKGARQAAAVKYLYEQACKDRWLLDASEILAAAYPDKPRGRSLRLQNLFSGNAEWREFIANPEQGRYGFAMD